MSTEPAFAPAQAAAPARARQPAGGAARARMQAEVAAGLRRTPPLLPPKFFYDDRGARLFDEITRLDAYYPTRTEIRILEQHLPEIAALIGAGARVVEFGSGSGGKTRALLRSLQRPAAYVPIDISATQLHEFAASLRREFPGLPVRPICADYTAGDIVVESAGERRTVAFFPGSTIGNLEEHDASAFLQRARRVAGSGGALLIGADLHKDRAVIERAYNDPEGVTAAFNLNMLVRLNSDCGTDFDVAAFEHCAIYDTVARRIEMRLVCRRATAVSLPLPRGERESRSFRPGDYIVTEYSHKYTPASFRRLAGRAGWNVARRWIDPERLFSVWLLEAGRAPARPQLTLPPWRRRDH